MAKKGAVARKAAMVTARRFTRPSGACWMPACACFLSTATTTWASRGCSPRRGFRKGSFYHHFKDKEDFALQVIDAYMTEVHAGLDACLQDARLPPLARVRRFFELTQQKYRSEGYMGCLLGGVGQELSGVSEVFRRKIETCFSVIADRLGNCFEEAPPEAKFRRTAMSRQMADILRRLLGRGRLCAAAFAGTPVRSPPCSTSISASRKSLMRRRNSSCAAY
jgi:AcrR family transcriptional regulator